MALSGLVPRQNPPQPNPIGAATQSSAGNSLMGAPRGAVASARPSQATDRKSSSQITDRDIVFLTSLAAMQIQYGQPHEAVAYLMAVRRMRPANTQILRLLAIALMKLEAWDQASVILDEMESLRDQSGPIIYLYRAIIRLRQSDLFGAKQLFARFCALRSGE